jgi:hypothetical protein
VTCRLGPSQTNLLQLASIQQPSLALPAAASRHPLHQIQGRPSSTVWLESGAKLSSSSPEKKRRIMRRRKAGHARTPEASPPFLSPTQVLYNASSRFLLPRSGLHQVTTRVLWLLCAIDEGRFVHGFATSLERVLKDIISI